MALLSGNAHRHLWAVATIAAAAVSSELSARTSSNKPSDSIATPGSPSESPPDVHHRAKIAGFAGMTFTFKEKNPACQFPDSLFVSLSLPAATPFALYSPYWYPKLAKPPHYGKESILPFVPSSILPLVSSSQSEGVYRWHLPDPQGFGKSAYDRCARVKTGTVIVLLGWLGAKQKHLKKYAEWYTSRGFHAVTFTFPMTDVMSYSVGGKAEQNIDLLAGHLTDWVAEEEGNSLVFHTFSNTGWLTYGVLLEKFQKQDSSAIRRIKGCIVDSAPAAAPDPQVFASGFSAAFLKKHSVAAKGSMTSSCSVEAKPAVMESALLILLEKFFRVVLNLPPIHGRLMNILELLASKQPNCPQLYLYSSADRVIPPKSVEAFIEGQRSAGHKVQACDFVSSPHVDHFRTYPDLYCSQLNNFLEQIVLSCCKDSC